MSNKFFKYNLDAIQAEAQQDKMNRDFMYKGIQAEAQLERMNMQGMYEVSNNRRSRR